MEAIVEVARRGSVFTAAAQQNAEVRQVVGPDHRLGFESAQSLFSEPILQRLDLLEMVGRQGTRRVEQSAEVGDSNPQRAAADVDRLGARGIIQCGSDGTNAVPLNAFEILIPLARGVQTTAKPGLIIPRTLSADRSIS